MVYNPWVPNVYEDEQEIKKILAESGLKYWDSEGARKRKEILVDIKGGKCEECGYDKSIYALDFHHENRDEKPFEVAWAIRNFTNAQFMDILIPHVKEATIMLCSNCHREEHWGKKK